jgi:hypothetical protein
MLAQERPANGRWVHAASAAFFLSMSRNKNAAEAAYTNLRVGVDGLKVLPQARQAV